MIKKSTIFDYLINVMVIFGVSILCISLCGFFLGNDAKEVSDMFVLGSAGISYATLVQFLGLSILVAGLRWLFFTDKLIKNCSLTLRSIFMFVCIIIVIGGCAALFNWFPVNMVLPWILFFASFFVCAGISVALSILKEKEENRKLQEALDRLKEED